MGWSLPGGGRFSPHFYTPMEQLEEAIDLLNNALYP
jgi:hypothetical protein